MRNPFKKFRAMLRLRKAVNMADEAYQKRPQRYYVLPTSDGKLAVIDKANFRQLKRKHYISQDVRTFDLIRECFYFTPYTDGHEPITPYLMKRKRLQYFHWCEAYDKLKKTGKKK